MRPVLLCLATGLGWLAMSGCSQCPQELNAAERWAQQRPITGYEGPRDEVAYTTGKTAEGESNGGTAGTVGSVAYEAAQRGRNGWPSQSQSAPAPKAPVTR